MNADRGSNWNNSRWDRQHGQRIVVGIRRGGFRGFPGYQGFPGRHTNNFSGNNYIQQWQQRPKRDSLGKRLTEKEIGVTEYVSDHEGFNGIIKARYSDFQVSEINENGELAKLTCMEAPKPPVDDTVDEDEDLLLTKYNVEILPMETWDNINKLVVTEHTTDKVEVDVTGMTKENRTKIHDAVKKAFGQSIVGSTVSVKDKKIVRFEKYRKGVRIDNRVKWIWPAEYVYFIVHKENCDTMDAARRIAERLRINAKGTIMGYAGTKDRRAKTSQWFSLRKVDPRRIATACQALPDVMVGNYSFASTPLQLGKLQGNRFRIALRNVTTEDEQLELAATLLKERGFINYYGLQRFGSRAQTPTYTIGLKLILGNLQDAVNCILEPRGGPLEHALRAYRDIGAAGAVRYLPRGAGHIEASLIRALAKYPRDLLSGLHSLSRNTRLLYVHSYQSLVWNLAVSERLRLFGLQPAEGDLVPVDTTHDDLGEVLDAEEDLGIESQPEDGDEDVKPEDAAESTTSEEKLTDNKDTENPKIAVKVLTEEDIKSGKYTIFDVIMPLPGSNIEYPPNMKEYYVELLKKDGLTTEMKAKIKVFSVSGAYRRILAKVAGFEWKTVRYSDPTGDLLLSDRDLLQGRTDTADTPDGEYKALLLSFSLPSSCYATMALRELLKVDTASDNQALKNNYHKKNETESGKETVEVESGEGSAEAGRESPSASLEKRKLSSVDED
ncbi:pseudouridylate synthase 7 homolog isoform X2 [Achroia grisella]|uniref:pseudouridylate synthase 7 homolog isoform X2 n=1 Tax=Achroia grisella TaxID=688607 RepID=UPI0027D2B321|nr:pseudouridylate synthase 7 homolog isoform X2 [Achroia grisella]